MFCPYAIPDPYEEPVKRPINIRLIAAGWFDWAAMLLKLLGANEVWFMSLLEAK